MAQSTVDSVTRNHQKLLTPELNKTFHFLVVKDHTTDTDLARDKSCNKQLNKTTHRRESVLII